MPAVIDMLNERGLVPSEALVSGVIEHLPDEVPFTPWRRGFTNVVVFGDRLNTVPFFCAYDHDVDERHRSQLAQLESSGGGVLGVTGLRAVILPTDDVSALGKVWESLLGSEARVRTECFVPARGPEVHLVTGDAPPALLLGVDSASDAATSLHEVGIRFHQQGETLQLHPADAVGLDIRLIE